MSCPSVLGAGDPAPDDAHLRRQRSGGHGERREQAVAGFTKDVGRWVMVPGAAGRRLPMMFERENKLRAEAEISPLNSIETGRDRRVGFITSGPAYMHVRESFPDAPVLKLGFACPVPLKKVREFAKLCDQPGRRRRSSR